MKKIIFILFLIVSSVFTFCRADEGMWIPILLKQLNEADMQKAGFKLTAEDIYSINKSSMKDAVVQFGGGCTAEVISPDGLILTNHHCGYGRIQSHSSVQNNLLANGFWAMNKKEELSNPGLTVTFIIRIEDVTAKILDSITNEMSETKRDSIITARSEKIKKDAIKGTHYEAKIHPFFNGNDFYLFIAERFKDVRLVGTPPESIGKFGGNTDNWVWPRHTGDFSLFRIYADKDNNPAEYSPDNVPFKPRYYFPISLKGVSDNDFTLVFGFPGNTTEYLPSYAVDITQNILDPIRIKIRKERLEIISTDMKQNKEVQIKYAAKYAGVSNYYKKWKGEIYGLKKSEAIQKKQQQEKIFSERVKKNPLWNKQYGNILNDYQKMYQNILPLQKTMDYFWETISAIEIIRFANNFVSLTEIKEQDEIKKKIETLKTSCKLFYKNYNPSTDKKIFIAMLSMYYKEVDKNMHPDFFKMIESKYKMNFEKFAEKVYHKSIFVSETKVMELLNNYSSSDIVNLKKDPAFRIAKSSYSFFEKKISPEYNSLQQTIDRLDRIYITGLKEVFPDKKYYPDANSTLRVSFGKVNGYDGRDAIKYNFFTTLDGIIEKEDSTNSEFIVPKKLKELYQQKNFGQYADNDGKIHVAFTASQHTTGGNSGSPVLDAYGNLVGVNFDRNWEGTQNDIMYDEEQGRNIILDIRYALFIIDKFAGALHLVQEMKLIR
ncbi:MAG: S46 family peptidase [Bacteroidota bacterium]